MSLESIMCRTLQVSATPDLQRFAAHVAFSAEPEHRALSERLAWCDGLVDDVRAQLAKSRYPEVREVLWFRKDNDPARSLEALRGERSIAVCVAIVQRVPDPQAIADVLGPRLSSMKAKVIVRACRWDLPPVLVRDALVRAGADHDKVAAHLTQATSDLSMVVTCEQVTPLIRLAALASPGTPDHVVAEHLGPLMRELAAARLDRAHRAQQSWVLRAIAKRPPNLAVLDAHLQNRHYGPDDAKIDVAFAHWSSSCQQALSTEDVTVQLAAALSPQDVHDVWNRLQRDQQQQTAQHFVDHRLCPIAVFDAALKYIDLKATIAKRRKTGQGSVWMAQREDVFKYVARQDLSLGLNVAALIGMIPEWTAGAQELTEWALDVCTEPGAEKVKDSSWLRLVGAEGFPRHRVCELPMVAMVAIGATHETRFDWVWTAVATDLGALAGSTNQHQVVGVLHDVLEPKAPFLNAIRATRAGFTSLARQ